jgi:integrase
MAGKTVEKEPKTDAGRRTVAIPGNILSVLEDHLAHYVAPEPDALVLPVTSRAPGIGWDKARLRTGRPDLRLHDLRHSGLTSTATGATPAELMRRAGHKSSAAAMRYQHATADRDAAG